MAEENKKVAKTRNGNDENDVWPTSSSFPRTFFVKTFSLQLSFFKWKIFSFSAKTLSSLQEEKETPGTRIISTICYNHHSLQHIILHGLPIKEIISSKQWMSYQFCSILINWKAARKTYVWRLFKAFVFLLICSRYIPNRNV